MPQVKCNNKSCSTIFTARQADINRGWGKFCSKSCKAIHQERITHQYKNYLTARENAYSHDDDMDCHPFSEDAFNL